MYLKKIEIQGFKSFANKIVLQFHQGITGIVGPNGSGKSNVSDAVRWVLGEQSAKQLRGGNMQDVIFAGTQLRKPQGYAYVMMTFDNTDHTLAIDFDEVTVSRRIYRSGESEYMINGSACRLKDIQEIFYDTGIGKDGYSIIGQGQVDKLLNGRPEERRELFDEAAGITKYKRRKNIAMKKLENERVNLVRISDIMQELEKQIQPLEKQSKIAMQYLSLKKELKRLEANNFILESATLQEQLNEILKKESILQEDLDEAKQKAEEIMKNYNSVEESLNQMEEMLSDRRQEIQKNTIQLGERKGQIKLLKEQIHYAMQKQEEIKLRLQSIEIELAGKKKKAEEYQYAQQGMRNDFISLQDNTKSTQKVYEEVGEKIRKKEEEIEKYKSNILEVIAKRSELKTQEQKFHAQIEQLQIRLSEIAKKLLKAKMGKQALKEEKSLQEKEFKICQQQLLKIQNQISGFEKNIQDMQMELTDMQTQVLEKQTEYQKVRARYDSLRNIAERYEGYGSAIRHIMETKRTGVHGVIADLIQVKPGFETALEVALGGRIQNIVTDNEETAKLLIEYLKKNKYGRAIFLPLTSVKERNQQNLGIVMKEVGVLGLAKDFIITQERYRSLIEYLLSKIIIVDHIDHAIAIAKKYHYEHRIVTKEGELLSPGGAMSGGAYKNTSSLLGRKYELEILKSQVYKSKESLDILENQILHKKEIQKQECIQNESIQKEYREIHIQYNAKKLSLENIIKQLMEIEKSEEELIEEKLQFEKQKKELLQAKEQFTNAILGLEGKDLEIQNEIGIYSKVLEDYKQEKEKLREDLTGYNMKMQSLEQRIGFQEENLIRIQTEEEALVKEKLELFAIRGESEESIVQRTEEIQITKFEILSTEKNIVEKQKDLEDLVLQKEKADINRKRYFDENNEISEKLSLLEKDIFRVANQRERADERLGNLINYMWNEYHLTLQTVLELKDDSLYDQMEIRKQADGLRMDIKKLGNVNVDAIEEYKEVSERYELMRSQHDDIIETENQLLQIITDLDIGMRKQFDEKFKLIQEQFNLVFKELFGGGTGKLILEDGIDPLEASVSVISQPPGKKLQNMMQLSGGEKALTAIALLFAIQNLKPSPFALLDEIEAALDDSNVERFAKYLHRLTDCTQFIVITHRRGTMASADRLYGITMQEKGVSTLVSVNLIEGELDK